MLNWCNLNLFDYNGYLVNRRCSLSFRPPPREWSDLLYPLGQTTGDWNDLLRCGHKIISLLCLLFEENWLQ